LYYIAPDFNILATDVAVRVDITFFLVTTLVKLWKPENSMDSLIANGTPRNDARSSVHSFGIDLCRFETESKTRSISSTSIDALIARMRSM
jgi:hypothetical protein